MPVDLGAHGHEGAGQVLDVRLAGGVPEHGPALGGDGRHERVLGPGDAGLVQEDVVPHEPLLGLELVAVADGDRGAQLLERQEVGVDPAAADDVAAGRRQGHGAEAGQQRSRQQDRGADAGAELGIERLGPHPARVDAHEIGPGPLGRGAEIDEEREHGLDVPDARDVVELHRAVGEHGAGEDRQRGVLVAGGPDRPAQRLSTADEETWRHGQS